MSWTCIQSFSFIPLTASEEKLFKDLKSRGLHFSNIFYHLKILGPFFLATDDLPRAHCDETEFMTVLLLDSLLYEPPYDLTNKMTSAPSEDSDSVWTPAQSDQSLRCPHEETLGPQLPIVRRLWSDWVYALVNRSLRWAHRSLCLFCSSVAQM